MAKLLTFLTSTGQARLGALCTEGTQITDLGLAYELTHGQASPALQSMLHLMHAGPAGMAIVTTLLENPVIESLRPLAGTALLAPVPVPEQIRDFSVFEKHLLQCGKGIDRLKLMGDTKLGEKTRLPEVWYEDPLYYKANRFSVVGHDAEIRWPSYAKLLDYELEFGVFIGRRGSDVRAQDAGQYIFGYSIYNDFSARDAQFREMPGLLGPAKGKDFDTGNAIGPWIVTPDELTDPYHLTMVVRVNGEERGRGNSGDMQHRFERMIEHASQAETLHVGEFLGSGTVGNGCGLESGRFLQPGDVVELEVEGIGTLRNRVVAPHTHGATEEADAIDTHDRS